MIKKKNNVLCYRSVPDSIPENVYGRYKNNWKWTGSWLPDILP